jgi:hypothetical protein
MKNQFLLTLVVFFTLHSGITAQTEQLEQIVTFSSRIDNPIKIEVEKQDNQIIFLATNRSMYPYGVEIEFIYLQNLSPYMTLHKTTVLPGKSRLFSLQIKNKEHGFNYNYSSKYYLASNKDFPIKKDHPYLIPISPGKPIKLYTPKWSTNTFFEGYFGTNPGDTIYCMRKGIVTAIPDMYHESDRLSQNKSLEIRHLDGSVMVYENLLPDSVSVKLGQTIYPGQPVGISGTDGYIHINLYEYLEQGKFRNTRLLYVYDSLSAKPFHPELDKKLVVHPYNICIKEMTKREIKKYKTN